MNILLVNMPCSSVRPALGISLLKSHLAADNVRTSIFYGNLAFARRIGPRFYHYISEVAPVESLLGEWLFAKWVFPEVQDDTYLQFLQTDFPQQFPPAAISRLLEARRETDELLDECLDLIPLESYDLIGFTSSFNQNMASLGLARRLKERRPDILLAFGGANCEDRMGLGLHRAFPFVDYVFCGEADISFPRVVRMLLDGQVPVAVPGVITRGLDRSSITVSLTPERVRDLDTLPFPDYDDFFDQYESLPRGSRVSGVPMETSRGCWWGEKHHCTFCGLNGMAMSYRSKSPARALAELDHLRQRYSVRDVQMVDNILDMRYLRSFLPALAKRRSKPALFYETKANLSRDHLVLFRSAGIQAIQPGIESLDSRVLSLMDKGTTAVRNVELLKHCREMGLWPHWNILYGFPGEPPDAYERMAKLVPSLFHLDPPNVCTKVRLDRFSPLYSAGTDAGLTSIRPARAYSLLYHVPSKALDDLAYYFDFDYSDGSVPECYTDELRALVDEWQQVQDGDLVFKDLGDTLSIVDTRQGTERELLLHGAERRLYLQCRSRQSARHLEDGFGEQIAPRRVADVLDEWTQARIMLHLDETYLSLAIDAAAAFLWRRRRKPTWQEVLQQSVAADSASSHSRRSAGLFATTDHMAAY